MYNRLRRREFHMKKNMTSVYVSYIILLILPMNCLMSPSKEESEIERTYQSLQKIANRQIIVERQQQENLAYNWQNEGIPQLQRVIVNKQLENLKRGYIDPVFNSLGEALKTIPMREFSFLDVACATGYYYEVLKNLEPRMNYYEGSDYSAAMITEAKKYYPDQIFNVQDATKLTYQDNSFDIVMLAGVIEHIPAFEKALMEAARVARHYVVIHRCPLINGQDNVYTLGAQYNIQTPRTFFSQDALEKIMTQYHCSLFGQRNVYQNKSDIRIFIFEKRSFVD